MHDVIVIGGGAIGLTTAFFFGRSGKRVALLDAGPLGRESSWAGAGIINPGNFEHARHPLSQLLGLSNARHPALAEELHDRTGIDTGYRRCGGVELESGVTSEVQTLWQLEHVRHEKLPCDAWGRIEPGLKDLPEPGYYLPDMAQLRNPRHLRALIEVCGDVGVELKPETPVRGFEQHGSRVTGVVTDAGTLEAKRCLIAAGAWSRQLLFDLGVNIEIKPVRGQMVLFHAPAPLFRSIVSRGKCYLVPRDDGRILAGSTEEDAGFTKATTPEAIAMLTEMAYSLVPALRGVPIETTWCGLRPGVAHELPYLGRVPGFDNVFVAAGHFRSGLMLSPGTAHVMCQLLRDETPAIDLSPFQLTGK